MSNWISGGELINRWDIKDFELFDLMKKGLQPYTPNGKKVCDLDSLSHVRPFPLGFYKSLIRSEQLAKKRYESQKAELTIPPKDCSYAMSFSLPPDEKVAMAAIATVKVFLFKKDEVSEFAEKNGLPSLGSTNDMMVAHKKEEGLNFISSSDSDGPTSEDKEALFLEDHRNAFLLKGEFWSVHYNGKDSNIKDMECIRYIVHLINMPNHPFYANELTSFVKGNLSFSDDCEDSEDQAMEHAGFSKEDQGKESFTLFDMPIEHLSDKDKEGIEKTLYKIWAKLNKAKEGGDEGSIKSASQDLKKANSYIYSAYGVMVSPSPKGLSFRYHRKLTNDAEKIRVGVRQQILRGIKHISKCIPSLANHLETCINTGTQCIYRPAPNHTKWRVEWNS